MDRPIALSKLIQVGVPELGVKILEAPYHSTLEAMVQEAIDDAAASAAVYPFIQGLRAAGSGGGATWRVMLTIAESVGWGNNDQLPCDRARFYCAPAQNAAQLMTVLAQLYARIAAAATASPIVWEPILLGTGRDGSYLVGLLWVDGAPGDPTYSQSSYAASGPYTAKTTILSFSIPQSLGGANANRHHWLIFWNCMLNDATGSGAIARLVRDTVTIQESEEIGSAAEWNSMGSHHIQEQSGAGMTFDLEIEPTVGGNAINVRACALSAIQIVCPGLQT